MNEERIQSLISTIHEINVGVGRIEERMDERFKHMEEKMETVIRNQENQDKRIRELELKGARRYDSIIEKVITLAVAAFIGWLLGNTGA